MTSPGPGIRPLHEKIDDVRAKIALLEGDRKAYYENSIIALSNSKRRIQILRKTNQNLRNELMCKLKADEKIINHVFQKHRNEKIRYAKHAGEDVIYSMDNKTCDSMKKLNSLKHDTVVKEKKLAELINDYNERLIDIEKAKLAYKGLSEEGRKLREIENRLDKSRLKCQEAEHIRRTFEQIKDKLQEEQMNYGNNLDKLEELILSTQKELNELKVMHNDARLTKERAFVELKNKEEKVLSERRERESELVSIRHMVDSKRWSTEKAEKREGRQSNEDNANDTRQAQGKESTLGGLSEEHHQQIIAYEEKFKRIKEATGVSDLDETVERFHSQGKTLEHLKEMKTEIEAEIEELRQERDELQEKFEEMKFTGQNEISSGQKILDMYEDQMKEMKERREKYLADLTKSSKLLVLCKSAIENIYDKVKLIKNDEEVILKEDSDEYLPDLINATQNKLIQLKEDLNEVDIPKELSELLMEEKRELHNGPEFYSKVGSHMPPNNQRIPFPSTEAEQEFDAGNDDLIQDDSEVPSRAFLKKQAQTLLDMKTKKRNPKKSKRRK